jgi:hypothetical protein
MNLYKVVIDGDLNGNTVITHVDRCNTFLPESSINKLIDIGYFWVNNNLVILDIDFIDHNKLSPFNFYKSKSIGLIKLNNR